MSIDSSAALSSLAQPEDFIMVQISLIDALGGDHLAAILLARIAYRARRGPWRATYDDLTAETRLTKTTMRRRLAVLRDAGLITAEPAGGFDQAMVYDVPGLTHTGHVGSNPPAQTEPVHRAKESRPVVQSGPMEESNLDHSSSLIESKKIIKKGPRPLPPDWTPNDKHRADAAAHSQNVEDLADCFRDYNLMKGKRFSDWDAAFRNWLRKDREFHPPQVPTWSTAREPSQLASVPPPPPSESLDEYNARIDREMAARERQRLERRQQMEAAGLLRRAAGSGS